MYFISCWYASMLCSAAGYPSPLKQRREGKHDLILGAKGRECERGGAQKYLEPSASKYCAVRRATSSAPETLRCIPAALRKTQKFSFMVGDSKRAFTSEAKMGGLVVCIFWIVVVVVVDD